MPPARPEVLQIRQEGAAHLLRDGERQGAGNHVPRRLPPLLLEGGRPVRIQRRVLHAERRLLRGGAKTDLLAR